MTKISALEALEHDAAARRVRRDEGPTRRTVLSVLGVLPVVGCAPTARPSTSGDAHDARVVILGGGLAGLHCCHRLADLGVAAVVYEATDRPGGRMLSATALFVGGETLTSELGGEFINSNDTELLTVMGELGLDSLDLYDDIELDEVAWVDGRRISSSELYAAFSPVVDAVDAALATIDGDVISYANAGGAADIDNTSAAAWLANVTDDPVAIAMMSMATLTDYGREMEEQSALNLLYWFGSDVEAYDERYKITDGVQQIPELLAAQYEDRVRYGKVVTSISEDSAGAFTVTFADGTHAEADFLVCALPFTILRELDVDVEMADVKRRCIDTLGYGTNAKLILPFQTRYWREQGDYGAVLTDSGLQAGWDQTALFPGTFGAFANFTGGAHGVALGEGSVAEQAEAALAQLEAFWPGIRDAAGNDPVRHHWPSIPTMKGSYSSYLVGQWTGIGGAEPEAIRRMFFCGEHTSYEFQGYMNGAAESGARAASEVIAAMGSDAGKRFGERAGVGGGSTGPRACRRRPLRRRQGFIRARVLVAMAVVFGLLCALALTSGNSRAGTPSPTDPEIAATWDGGSLTLAEVTANVQAELMRREAESEATYATNASRAARKRALIDREFGR